MCWHLRVGKDCDSLLQLFFETEGVDSFLQTDTGCIQLESGNYFCETKLQCEFCIVKTGFVIYLLGACG